jgi:outer membrane protein assembly factor BamB
MSKPKMQTTFLFRAFVLSRFRDFTILVAWLFCSPVAAEDWPGWRGPRGDGTSLETNVPVRWSATENIAWKTPVPGYGHSSPIVSGNRIFVTSCIEKENRRILVCFDRRSGKLLWQRDVVKAALEKKHVLNSFASSTPTTDGEKVFVTFLEADRGGEFTASAGRMVVAAYDFDGNQKWLVRPGKFSSVHGYCSSPMLYKDKVIVNGDHDGDAYLVALARNDGRTLWKIDRENKVRSYVTPIIREIDGRTQMILTGSKCVASYDPNDGVRHWIINGPTEQFVASVVYNGELLFLTAGYPEHHMLAIRPDGRGDVTDSHVVWRTTKACSYVPSPIAVGKYFLVVSDDGIASCFEAADGTRHWMKRIGSHYSASLVTAGGLVYFTADDGKTTVVRPGVKYEAVTQNDLGERVYASPAICGGRMFIRGEQHLYSIGSR